MKNKYKFGNGHPLQSGEIYGTIEKANSEENTTHNPYLCALDVSEKNLLQTYPTRESTVNYY